MSEKCAAFNLPRRVDVSSYLISACELKIVEHGQINVHHDKAHGDNSTHDVEIVDAVDVNLRRRSKQRDSRDEAEIYSSAGDGIENSLESLLIPRYERHRNGKCFHVASADEIVSLVGNLLRLLLEKSEIDADCSTCCQHHHEHGVVEPSEFLQLNFHILDI